MADELFGGIKLFFAQIHLEAIGFFCIMQTKRGQRLSWELEKLGTFLRYLEGVREELPEHEEDVEFLYRPNGLHIYVRVADEFRYHLLYLDQHFFARYHCAAGFRVPLKLRPIIDFLTKMERTHKIRCLKMEDQPEPDSSFLLTAIPYVSFCITTLIILSF
jgi:hypothetical protein